MHELIVRGVSTGVEFEVIAKPKARKEGIDGVHDGALRISVAAAPEKGRANDAIVSLLARLLDLPISAIEVVSGQTARRKRVRVLGVAPKAIHDLVPKGEE